MLTLNDRQIRSNVRNAYLAASEKEVIKGLRIYLDKRDYFAAACLVEFFSDEPYMAANVSMNEIYQINRELNRLP